MARYMFQGSYSREGARGLLREGGSRRYQAVAQLVRSLGGRLEGFYYAFGDTDLYMIVDLPDHASAAAASLIVAASGAGRWRTIADDKHLFDLADTGIYLEYDLFGLETSWYPYNPAFDMPNDAGRMAQIVRLIDRGHLDQVLMSHDIAYKCNLVKYGGFGYPHLLTRVVPRLRRKGVDEAGMRRLLVENPQRAFSFV